MYLVINISEKMQLHIFAEEQLESVVALRLRLRPRLRLKHMTLV